MAALSQEALAALVEFGEAEAWANYYRCAPEDFVKKYRLEVKQIGRVWVTMIPGLDWTFFNRIVGLGVGEAATQSMLDEAIAMLQDAECKNYMAQVSPLAQPSQLPAWLETRGFTSRSTWAKVYRGNEPAQAVQTDLQVLPIGIEHADDFADITLSAFNMPPELRPLLKGHIDKPNWHHYIAFDGTTPVSAASMFVSNGVGWLGFGSTLASQRKRGGQSALFSRRIEDGLALGCRWLITETGEDTPEAPNPSYHNMLRAGFKLAYMRRNYVHEIKAG